MTERQKEAERLLSETSEIAAALETIAYDDNPEKVAAAQKVIRFNMDGYWHAIKIGTSTSVGNILAD